MSEQLEKEREKDFSQKQEIGEVQLQIIGSQLEQEDDQKVEPGNNDALGFESLQVQEREQQSEVVLKEVIQYEFDCEQILESDSVQEQHQASESQAMQEKVHVASSNQEEREHEQSSQDRYQEPELESVYEESILYAQKEKIGQKEDFVGVLGLLVNLVVPLIAPVADKPDAYILYCVLLFVGYFICWGIAFRVSRPLSDSEQADRKEITRRFVKMIAITFLSMSSLASLTYYCAFHKQIPSGTNEVITEESLSLAINPNRMLAAGAYHSVFIREDGSVGTAGLLLDGRCDVSEWNNIVAVSAFSHTVGLKSDGTVVATGLNKDGQCDVSKWENVVDIDAGYFNTIGAHKDGTVSINGYNKFCQYDALTWTDIIQVEAGEQTVYGLKKNGTVVSAGSEISEQRNVSSWSNILEISSGKNHVVGLREDGTVVATGDNSKGQCNVTEWTDIIAISAGNKHTVGLKSDGTVVSTGDDEYEQCKQLSCWEDAKAISAGMFHTIGRNGEGAFLKAGSNENGQLYLP